MDGFLLRAAWWKGRKWSGQRLLSRIFAAMNGQCTNKNCRFADSDIGPRLTEPLQVRSSPGFFPLFSCDV